MEKLARWIGSNSFAAVLIFVVSILGFLITLTAFIVQMVQNRRKSIGYSVSTATIVENSISNIRDLKITYNDMPIETIAISFISVWNKGNTLIDASHFYEGHNLEFRIRFSESDKCPMILDATCSAQEPTIEPYVEDTPVIAFEPDVMMALPIGFKYLEKGQRIEYIVYHTCSSLASHKSIRLYGKLKEGSIKKSIDVSEMIENMDGDISISNIAFQMIKMIFKS